MERGSDERVLLVALWLVLTCLGCATHRQVHLRSAIATSHVAREAGLTGQQKQQVANECFMGMLVKRAADPGSTEYVYRDGYVLNTARSTRFPSGCVNTSARTIFDADYVLSDAGDSGSLWLEQATRAPVGLPRGHGSPRLATASSILKVLAALQLTPLPTIG